MTLAFAPPIPVIETQRLILRGPKSRDYEPVAAFFADTARSSGFGGPLDRSAAWRWFASNIGHWSLRGYGFWTVETRERQIAGLAGFWSPEGWDEPELGCAMFEGAEGKGYAFEATSAARRYGYGRMGFTTISSRVPAGNLRAEKLAERLGAHREHSRINPVRGMETRFRHPSRDALAAEDRA